MFFFHSSIMVVVVGWWSPVYIIYIWSIHMFLHVCRIRRWDVGGKWARYLSALDLFFFPGGKGSAARAERRVGLMCIFGKGWAVEMCNWVETNPLLREDSHFDRYTLATFLIWEPKMQVWKMIVLFNRVIFRFYVKFQGCMFQRCF